uniref:Uncharacterized protein n=1 Tax=Chenopodium quinoa TaxID=63459 RepID=A0A803NDB3_CHEQI
MGRIDPEKKVLTAGDGRELPLCLEQWRYIFRLPRGTNQVPVKVKNATMQVRVDGIVQHYGEVKPDGTCHIKIQQTVDELPLMPINTEHEKDEFMKAFLLAMLGLLICPTTNGQSLATSLLPAVSIGDGVQYFDWCACAHSWLMTCVIDFRRRLNKIGSEVWTEKKFVAAIQADLLPSLDYGKVKTVDVAYGERNPMVGRDSCQPLEVRVADEVLDMIRPLYERMEKKLEKKIEKIFEKNMEKVFEKYMEKELE